MCRRTAACSSCTRTEDAWPSPRGLWNPETLSPPGHIAWSPVNGDELPWAKTRPFEPEHRQFGQRPWKYQYISILDRSRMSAYRLTFHREDFGKAAKLRIKWSAKWNKSILKKGLCQERITNRTRIGHSVTIKYLLTSLNLFPVNPIRNCSALVP
jgi:hypothetical protein